MKKLLQKLLPGLVARYRQHRDIRLHSAQRMRPTRLGFDFIGVPGMPEEREASGEVGLLRDELRTAALFIDIGANCGLYALIACQSGVPVLAIEPNRLNFLRLEENIRHNRFGQAKLLNIALGDKSGRCLLYGGGEGASLLKNWGGMAATYAEEVEVRTLDELARSDAQSKRLLIKMDVEGHELAVLAGSKELLASSVSPVWIIEHSFRENQDGKINPRFRELFEVFWAQGYACLTFDINRRSVSPADVDRWLLTGIRDYGGINYLFTKPSNLS